MSVNIYANTTTCSGSVFQSYNYKTSSVNCEQYYENTWMVIQCGTDGNSVVSKACNSSSCTSCVDLDSTGSNGNCSVILAPGVSTPLSGTFVCSSAFGVAPAAGLIAMAGVIAAALVM